MILNNNLNPLPWYDSLDDQNHLKSWAYGKVYPLITQSRLLLPFQVVRPHLAATPITSFKLINFETGVEYDITTEMNAANLIIKEFTDYDLIINYGRFLLTETFSFKGLFYASMTDGNQIWYSEVFNFVLDVSPYVKVVWYKRNDIQEYKSGHIDYNDGYQNFCYVISEIGKPKYPFNEDVQERDGYTFIEKQISEKVFMFHIMAPEYLLDAMRIIRMHDYIYIQQGSKIWDVEQFLITPEWEDQGDLANTEIEFHVDSVIKSIGKGYDALLAGDYNDDFNNDFSGGEGEGGEDVSHTFLMMTGSTVTGVGNFVRGCHVLIKVKATQDVVEDFQMSFIYTYNKPNFGAGVEYEVTISRDGYIDNTFDFTGVAGTTRILLIENPATIYFTKTTGGFDNVADALVPNVTVEGKTVDVDSVVISENTGPTGVLVLQAKKGLSYNLTYTKAGYTSGAYYLTENAVSAFYIVMTTL